MKPGRRAFFRYAAEPSRQTVGIVLVILATIYLIIPITLLPVITGSMPVDGRAIAFCVVVAAMALVMNVREIVLFRAERWDDYFPIYNFVELMLGVIGVTTLGIATDDASGLYRPLILLVLLLTAVIFEGPGLVLSGVLCFGALSVVTISSAPTVMDGVWLVVVYGGVFAITACVAHYLVRRSFAALSAADALADFANETSAVTDWIDDLQPCLPTLARAMHVERIAIAVRVREPGDGHEATAVPATIILEQPEPWVDRTIIDQQLQRELTTVPDVVDVEGGLFAVAIATSQVDAVIVFPPTLRVLGTPLEDQNAVTAINLVAGVAERLALIGRLRDRAATDELTGLGNRRRLFEVLATEIERSKRTGSVLSLAIIDLDHFKQFNDAHGHQAGDGLLRTFADTVSERIRAQDTLARYGGEEFCLVLPETASPGAVELLASIRRGGVTDATGRTATYSVGVAEWAEGDSTDDLVRRADVALYDAKASGRDCVVVAAPVANHPQPDWATKIATAANANVRPE